MKDGVTSVRYAGTAVFKLGKYATDGVNSRTRLDIALGDGDGNTEGDNMPTVITMQGNGNIGIGTTSPSHKLDIDGTFRNTGEATVGDKLYLTNVASSGADGILAFDSTNTASGSRIFSFTRGGGNALKYHSYGYHLWQSGAASGAADSTSRMILDSSGRLGIGTTSPSYKLHVEGTGLFVADSATGRVLRLRDRAANNSNIIQFEDGAGSSIWEITGRSNEFYIYKNSGNGSAYKYRINSNGDHNWDSGKMYLSYSTGNVGIGTSSPSYKLDVNGVSRFNGATISGQIGSDPAAIVIEEDQFIFTNDGASANPRKLIGKVNDIISIGEGGTNLIDGISLLPGVNGPIRFYAGSTEYVRFDGANQRVGIGTTSPAEKLHVAGTARFTDSVRIDTTGTALEITGTTTVDGSDVSIYLGNSPSSYGFYITYVGSGSGNTNAFRIQSTNAGDPKTLLISNQDGIVNFPTGLQLNGAGVATQSWVSSQSYATQSYVNTAVSNLVDSAPSTLDTLNELAAALGDDPNFATTVTNSIAGKVSKSGDTMTGDLVIGTAASAALTQAFGNFDQLRFDNSHSDTNRGPNKIVMHDNGNTWIGGFGIHSDTVSYYTGGHHRWYKTNSQTSSSQVMQLDEDGNLTIPGTLSASGYNKSNWDTAYSWGNHAGQYLPINGGTVGGAVTINGPLVVNGTITENSSLRVKENIITSEGHLEKVNKLRPVKYNKIDSDKTEIGLIAEEVEEVYPEFIQYDENGDPIGIHYSRLTASLIGAVKELTKEVEELKSKING